MIGNDRWQLPQGVEELLPRRAAALEALRVRLLGAMQSRGYQLVSPPMIEFLESLLTGTGAAAERATYKVTDSETGRTMGVRSDITPQVARIDAHYLSESEVNRLCYAGPIVRTHSRTPGGAREELQLGGELFGVADLSADCEVIDTMLGLFNELGTLGITLSLGHVGIYRELAKLAEINKEHKSDLLTTLQQFSIPDMDALISSSDVDLSNFRNLMNLSGDTSVLDSARKVLPKNAEITKCLDQLAGVCEFVISAYPNAKIHIDLADVRGYQYHTGIIFECLVDGVGQALANGGRYDAIGAGFGRSRPATGFSADLKALLLLQAEPSRGQLAILAPCPQDQAQEEGLRIAAAKLRASGEQVINKLSENDAEQCDRQLIQETGEWLVKPL